MDKKNEKHVKNEETKTKNTAERWEQHLEQKLETSFS